MSSDTQSRKHIIVGTSGHIDHGKTALVKAMTGVDADTLAEEKRRGITIELGFVFMKTPDPNCEALIIDVPGHEKLIKTMVAGAANIDVAVLVVAADDGVNKQTEEHFDILRTLEIPAGVVALTKCDLINEDETKELTKAVRRFVRHSFLERAPIIATSAIDRTGIDELKQTIYEVGSAVRHRRDTGVFRLPVDRVFTMQGFGTVVAGTVLSGAIEAGDEVEVFPEGIRTKVRGVQVHHEKANKSVIGKRTALNLLNVEKDRLHRGQTLGAPDTLLPSNRFDGNLNLLKSSRVLKNLTRVKFYTGTSESLCRVALLDRNKLQPGDSGPAQFILESQTVALPGDRYVIRTVSPLMTVGGGVILDANPVKHKRFDENVLAGLKKLEGNTEAQTEQMVFQAGNNSIENKTIFVLLGKAEADITAALDALVDANKIHARQEAKTIRYLHADFRKSLCERFVGLINQFLQRNPDQLSAPFNDMRSAMLKHTDQPTFRFILDELIAEQVIEREGTSIWLCGYQVPLSSAEEHIAEQVEKILIDAGIECPLTEKIRKRLDVEQSKFNKIMAALNNRKRVIRMTNKVSYHQKTFAKIEEIVLNLLEKNHSITIAQLRDELGVSRKYTQAILEYFDEAGITVREGDKHILP